MKCKLCQESKPLVGRSHIIPNFMYKELFDDKNRFCEISINNRNEPETRLRQSGIYATNILCVNCETKIIGEYDRYACQVLYHERPRVIENRQNEKGMKYTFCGGIDYKKFKLFLMSLIWRSSICKCDGFKSIRLGKYEETFRKCLYEKSPPKQNEFPCILVTYRNLIDYPFQIIKPPIKSRLSGGYVYYIPISGIIYIFFVSPRNIPEFVYECTIRETGEMKIINSTDRIAKTIMGKILSI
jgi:hypothetical protein